MGLVGVVVVGNWKLRMSEGKVGFFLILLGRLLSLCCVSMEKVVLFFASQQSRRKGKTRETALSFPILYGEFFMF